MTDDDAMYADTPESDDHPVPARAASDGKWSGGWRRRIDGPDRHTYVVLREHFRTQCQAARAVCWLCQGAIDYGLRHPHPMAFELDHFVPVSVDESLALVPSNFRASHGQHNRLRAAAGDSAGFGGGGGGATGVAVFVVDGRRIEYEYSVDVGAPSEPW